MADTVIEWQNVSTVAKRMQHLVKECFYIRLEQDTLAILTTEKCSYSDAKRQATDRLVKSKRKLRTYAAVALQSPPASNENAQIEP